MKKLEIIKLILKKKSDVNIYTLFGNEYLYFK